MSPFDMVQPSVTSGNTYVVPATGTVTSWSTNAAAGAGQMLTMKIFRKVAEPTTYMVVGHDGPRPLEPSSVNTFPASISVEPGDLLGVNDANASFAVPNACTFDAPGDLVRERAGDLPDGASGEFGIVESDLRANVTAVVVPSNAFSFGGAKRNKKKGTATLTVDVPNPGELALSGKGLRPVDAAGAVAAKTVTDPGPAKLLIKPKGKKRKKLNATGKVKVKFGVTYTPTGGDPNTQSRKLTLKRKLR